ncbi:MAG: NAD(P)-binding protein [Chitinophagaceae bacterium]|nr:NAD(P)-binding protein [Chitinophagaceae bacterium]
MKIGILGAGISGLSIARLLSKHFETEVLERHSIAGGIARTREAEGIAYHVTGGHCFNSKYQEVMDFVFGEVLPKKNWHAVTRNAVIRLMGNEVSYPIEYAIKQIHELDQDLAIRVSSDFLGSNDDGNYGNLEDWFRKKFGNTLSDIYFIPYNRKIWNRDPANMSHAWVEGKLPIPDKRSFFKGLISNESDKMPHSSFYYPNSNNQNTFIDSLAEGVNITCNYAVSAIAYNPVTTQWTVNGEKKFDLIISTLPLDRITGLLQDVPGEILGEAAQLKYNKVTTMLWETTGTDRTWTYVPEDGNFFHRYIHIGNFFSPSRAYSITEVVGEKTYQEMVENGRKDAFLKRPIDYHVSEHAYVVFDENYERSTTAVKGYLQEKGIYTLGRFGEWQYYNMDICIKRSMELADEIVAKHNSN